MSSWFLWPSWWPTHLLNVQMVQNKCTTTAWSLRILVASVVMILGEKFKRNLWKRFEPMIHCKCKWEVRLWKGQCISKHGPSKFSRKIAFFSENLIYQRCLVAWRYGPRSHTIWKGGGLKSILLYKQKDKGGLKKKRSNSHEPLLSNFIKWLQPYTNANLFRYQISKIKKKKLYHLRWATRPATRT